MRKLRRGMAGRPVARRVRYGWRAVAACGVAALFVRPWPRCDPRPPAAAPGRRCRGPSRCRRTWCARARCGCRRYRCGISRRSSGRPRVHGPRCCAAPGRRPRARLPARAGGTRPSGKRRWPRRRQVRCGPGRCRCGSARRPRRRGAGGWRRGGARAGAGDDGAPPGGGGAGRQRRDLQLAAVRGAVAGAREPATTLVRLRGRRRFRRPAGTGRAAGMRPDHAPGGGLPPDGRRWLGR